MLQSSHDTFSTVRRVGCEVKSRLLPALEKLRAGMNSKATELNTTKIGRTHTQDSLLLTLGRELSTYVKQLDNSITRVRSTLPRLCHLATGGAAVGAAVGTVLELGKEFADKVSSPVANHPLIATPNNSEVNAAHNVLVEIHNALNTVAVLFMNICKNNRFVESGLSCELGELSLPEKKSKSTIMQGKVNPAQCEVMQVAAQVMGNQVALSVGEFELDVFLPFILRNVLQSTRLLANSAVRCRDFCVDGVDRILCTTNSRALLESANVIAVTTLPEPKRSHLLKAVEFSVKRVPLREMLKEDVPDAITSSQNVVPLIPNRGPTKRKLADDMRKSSFELTQSPKDHEQNPNLLVDVHRNRRLDNTGNSCYLNATMQALSACFPLMPSCWRLRGLDNDEKSRKKHFGTLNQEKFKVLQDFLKMIVTLGTPLDNLGVPVLQNSGPPSTRLLSQFTREQLRSIRLAVGRVNKEFDNGDQQDAHEYLMTIFGIIDDLMGMIAVRDGVDLNRKSNYGISICSLNPMKKFMIKVETVYRCQRCQTETFKTELRSDLCLIINEETTEVQNLLSEFVKWSPLEKTCSGCKHAVASSCERIVDFPNCLMVNLKRYERVGDSYRKKSCSVKPSFHLNARELGMIVEFDDHPELVDTFNGDEQMQEEHRNSSGVSHNNNDRSPGKLLGGSRFGLDSVDDEVIVECEDNNPEFDFKFLSDQAQLQQMLEKMRIKLTQRQLEDHVNKLQELPQTKFHKNDHPKAIENGIDGDGNCFYRAVSWCLTGSQNHYAAIRECVSEFVKANGAEMSRYCNDVPAAVNAIQRTGNWASATDIIALSTCFNIEIYTYLTTGWTKYCPREHPSFYQAFEKRNGSIYLQNTGWHYEPVLSISTNSSKRYPLIHARKRAQSDDEPKGDVNDGFPRKRAPLARPPHSRTKKQSSNEKKNVSAYKKDPGEVNYVLVSVICHEGTSPDKGHYVAYTKGAYDNKWTFCSDRTVHTVTEREVIEKTASTGYVLFYTRIYEDSDNDD